MSLKAGEHIAIPFFINQTDLLAGTSQELIAPVDGYLVELHTTVQTAVTTGGAITVKTGDALATTVAGLTNTIADAATVGTRLSSSATSGSASRVVSKGDRISIQSAAGFATAGAVNGFLVLATSDVSPAL